MAGKWTRCALAGALLLLGGCASQRVPSPVRDQPAAPIPANPARSESTAPAKPALTHYRCDQGLDFDVRFGDDEAELTFPTRGSETLARDAGGETPQQSVYSSTALKAEFGLGADGRGAKLNFADPPLQAHCTRD
jgi:hypothetical protein